VESECPKEVLQITTTEQFIPRKPMQIYYSLFSTSYVGERSTFCHATLH